MATEDAEAQLVVAVRRAVEGALGHEPQRIELLPGALGLRRFARVWPGAGPVRTLIARVDAPEDPAGRPPGVPPEPALEPIRALLERHGLPVPARLGADAGIELLEDAGDLTLADAVRGADPAARRALYQEVCDVVPRLQRIEDPGPPVQAFERRLGPAHFEYKAALFAEWSLASRGREATPAEVACVRDAFSLICREAQAAPQRLAHRDLQSQNLLVRPDLPAGRRVLWIDLQGALLAPPEYDLVSLLRDSYVELPADEIETLAARVRVRLPDAPDADSFAWRFDALTLTRKGKDHARFLYAAHRRGDTRYLAYVPTTVRHLKTAARAAAAREPRLASFGALVAELPETPCAR